MYETIRYMKKKNLHLTKDNSSDELRNKISNIEPETNLAVKLTVNPSVYVADVAELTLDNIHSMAMSTER